MPERDTTPTDPGLWMCAGMMPSFALPGEMIPGQLGPIRRTLRPASDRFTRTSSRAGIPSVMQTISSMPASAASRTASAAIIGGTKISDAVQPVARFASATVLNTGTPSTLVPPLPGVMPATILVPYSRHLAAWNCPSLPVRP